MTNQPTPVRPPTITAADWSQVAEAVKAGECIVESPLYSNKQITNIESIKPNSAGWDVAITDTKGTYRTWADVELTVTWLQPTVTSPAAAGSLAREGFTIDSIHAELTEMDAAYYDLPDVAQHTTDSQRERMNKATFDVHLNLSYKLHYLLETIASQAAQILVLQAQLKTSENQWVDMAAALGMAYEETTHQDMVAAVKAAIAASEQEAK